MRCFDAERPLPDNLTDLRGAALDYGRRTRHLGLRPEQVVIALKRLLTRHGGPEFAPRMFVEEPTCEAPLTTTSYGRVLAWCLDGYFADSQAREHA